MLISSIVPVVAQREAPYPLSFHPLADCFLSNRGYTPLLYPERSPRRAIFHRGPIPFSSFQKSLGYWTFDPVNRTLSHSSRSPVTNQGSRAPLRSFAQQALCLPHLCISWGEGGGGGEWPF